MKDANRNPLLYNSKTSTILLGSYKKAALEICNFEWRIFFILILSSTNTKQQCKLINNNLLFGVLHNIIVFISGSFSLVTLFNEVIIIQWMMLS